MVPTLVPEIIVLILLKLPIKSLLQCKYVCKLFHSLISDPYFIKSHYKLSTINNKYTNHQLIFSDWAALYLKICPLNDVLFDKSIDNALELGYPFTQRIDKPSLSLAGSCNGLLFIAVERDTPFICNPSIKKSSRVPYCGFKMQRGWHVLYGSGYDESTDDYKVVAISRCDQNRAKKDNRVNLYSLKSRYWKRIDDFPLGYPLGLFGKYANGAIHWAAREDDYGSFDDASTIVSLDLANETYGEVLQPVYDEGRDKNLTLGVLREWLCVLCNYGVCRADVWVMKVKDSWTKLVSIPYHTDPGREQFSVPIFISNDGKILLKLGSDLVVYDSKNMSSYERIENSDYTHEAWYLCREFGFAQFPLVVMTLKMEVKICMTNWTSKKNSKEEVKVSVYGEVTRRDCGQLYIFDIC